MKAIMFKNDGVIDLMAIKTFGVSAKETENPIGFFGTGLKYAIAILIREGCQVELHAGGETYLFNKQTFEMRGKTFEGIAMNGEMLPFTTELGKNWQLWQAFRELYCNTMDEGGTVGYYHDSYDPKTSTIFIVKSEAFEKIYHERGDIILTVNRDLLISDDSGCEVFNVPNKSIFYRGIRVMDAPKRSLFTYNILHGVQLTEDRTVKYNHHVMEKVQEAITKLSEPSHIYTALTADRDTFEKDFSFEYLNWSSQPVTKEFMDVVAREYNANNDKLNYSARNYYTKILKKSSPKNYEPEELTQVEQMQLDRCVKICTKVFPEFADYKILVVKNLGQETVATADMSEGTMVISKKCFSLGTKFLCSTLIEEYMHLKTGFGDETRQLQTYLFDTICSLIENHITKEPI